MNIATKIYMKGYMYILECSDESYYIGSTRDLLKRFRQHLDGEGAYYTSKRLPVKLVYFEEYDRIDRAFYLEKQIQRWSGEKKRALVEGNIEKIRELAECKNDSHSKNGPRAESRGSA